VGPPKKLKIFLVLTKKGLQVKSIEFKTFIDLVTFDLDLVKIEHDINTSEKTEKSLSLDVQRLHQELLDVKQSKHDARKAVDEKELYMKVLDDKESDLKYKISAISNQKEYKSLQKETLAINEDRMRHEKELLALWSKYEAIEKVYQAKYVACEESIKLLTDKIQTVKSEIKSFENKLHDLNMQRVEKSKNVPQEWLDSYVNMKGRVANPVVPVIHESCDGCFYSVTSKDLQVLRQGKLLQCRDCYRLLYLPE